MLSKQVKIRLANADGKDIEELVRLAREGNQASRYRSHRFSSDTLEAFFRDSVNHPKTHGFLLAEREGEIVGCLFATASRLMFADAVVAQTLFFFVQESARNSTAAVRLLKGFEVWAKNRNAREISIHITMGVDSSPAVSRFLKRKGYLGDGMNMYCEL